MQCLHIERSFASLIANYRFLLLFTLLTKQLKALCPLEGGIAALARRGTAGAIRGFPYLLCKTCIGVQKRFFGAISVGRNPGSAWAQYSPLGFVLGSMPSSRPTTEIVLGRCLVHAPLPRETMPYHRPEQSQRASSSARADRTTLSHQFSYVCAVVKEKTNIHTSQMATVS